LSEKVDFWEFPITGFDDIFSRWKVSIAMHSKVADWLGPKVVGIVLYSSHELGE